MTDEAKGVEWPEGERFTFYDEPGAHDPCYVIMPGGAMIPLNHHAGEGVDVARAHFIIDACNAALAQRVEKAGAKLLAAMERYGFPVSEAASTANMSIEARDLHNAARRFKIAINSTGSIADEPAMTNGQ